MLDNIIENLELTEPHQAFFMLKNCLSIPKLIYLLRSAPCFKCKKELEVFTGLSQMQLQKSLEQYQKIPKIPKPVVVQHKIGVRMVNVKNRTKYHLQNKLK